MLKRLSFVTFLIACLAIGLAAFTYTSAAEPATPAKADNATAPSKNGPLQVPLGPGFNVCLEDADGKFVGMTYVFGVQPDPAKPGELKAAIRSASTYIGLTKNRPDVVRASGTVLLTNDPTLDLAGGGECHTVCTCASPIICSPARTATSVNPVTDAFRKNPNPPGGSICGCSGACGTCEKCTVICSPLK
ncbi:MAG: hypothetical protein A3B30_02180 [Candidatus Komeilibacteria bacterium RIFCSPLOWO2_01_FULL_52_15]|uniref:4Fe-4S ferredoxin-type domain-containing protein n=1 Tax=Candidatus Komeilibacteria bacterium RIFCSPLOWO2_01_FULL_52_15 TaxID=1798551 RepID=A0A1G2BSJ6_9BACT|nr:MAG: hypothetical protein A3B30_02180 [Candidatus Komeilibacteria bacterium RIFCSPLOWO2_01_FULL_52_15]